MTKETEPNQKVYQKYKNKTRGTHQVARGVERAEAIFHHNKILNTIILEVSHRRHSSDIYGEPRSGHADPPRIL